jgi:hypothetical protein
MKIALIGTPEVARMPGPQQLAQYEGEISLSTSAECGSQSTDDPQIISFGT